MYRLNIHDVQRRLHEKTEKKLLCYDKVLEICHKRIIACTDRERTHCFFEFPEYIIGFPLFDLNACMEHCKKNLISSGFLVHYHFPNKFYISWDIDEIKEHKTQQRRNTPLSSVVSPQTVSQSNQSNQAKQAIQQRKAIEQAPIIKPQQSNAQVQETTQNIFPPVSRTLTTQQNTPYISSVERPEVFKSMPFDLYNKITQPLPSAPLKYDPNDIVINNDVKSTVLQNTYFPNNLKQLLTSDIGANNKKISQKQSGKLSLNI
jgi:hypothetical protein